MKDFEQRLIFDLKCISCSQVTKIETEMYEAIKAELPDIQCSYNTRARTLSLKSDQSNRKAEKQPGTLAIISGSSPDLRVAEECRIVAEYLGCYVFQLKDLKVANLEHVLANLSAIRAADVVVVVSGLDGALAAVLAGLVESPVIAVPTSAGHGATLGGLSPMLASISSSTPVTVVNVSIILILALFQGSVHGQRVDVPVSKV